MSHDILQRIRDMQFNDKDGAQALLLSFIQANFPQLDVISLELTPLAVSLNSFNGFLTLRDGTRRFFKTHTETDTVIDEYYNADMLSDAGYPIIKPVFKSTEPGKQLLVYEVIDDESVFDVVWRYENENASYDTHKPLLAAQSQADDDLLQIYRQTLDWQNADDAAQAPIHQLFHHRLTQGRLDRFYGAGTTIDLPHGTFTMADVRRMKWVINGQVYHDTLDDIIERAKRLLNPQQAGPSIVGHGDAHNGNVFYRQHDIPPSLLYFDPAFAGRHHPLLDMTKPLFHNVFAMWMYFPQEIATGQTCYATNAHIQVDGDTWHITHDYKPDGQYRTWFLGNRGRLLHAILPVLRERGWLREDWRAYLKAALFCCPFLTMNLADNERFPPVISLIGLCMAVEMGAESFNQRSLVDRILDGNTR